MGQSTMRNNVKQILDQLLARTIDVQQANTQLLALNLKITNPALGTCYDVARDFAAGFMSYNDVYSAFGV